MCHVLGKPLEAGCRSKVDAFYSMFDLKTVCNGFPNPNDVVIYTDPRNPYSPLRGKNYIEIRTLATTYAGVHLVLISPLKVDLVLKGEFLNSWKLIEFFFSNISTIQDAKMFVGFTSMVGFTLPPTV